MNRLVPTESVRALEQPRSAGRLFDVKLLVGVVVVIALLVLSLFTGVYDVAGAADGAEMFQITRIPRTTALVLAGAAMA
ncbi:ABC transporter permease, partial [Pseudomonas sp. BGM005]|nr:ABC transporter permease [Pseudomonas sp. BG5]